jgi:ribose transport system ATP-binding protein
MALLELHGLTKSFGATTALDGVELSIDAGEVHALIGENGAGKSTLLNILSGALSQDRGEMMFAGAKYVPRGPADARALGIAHIHQELSLCPHLSVSENISLGIEPSRYGAIDKAALDARAEALLSDFGCEHIGVTQMVGRLTIPDQQIVEICRALATNARLILMDEPTSSLSRTSVERLFRLIAKLREQGIAIIYISHFLEEVREVATRFTVLRDGKSVAFGELRQATDVALIKHMVGRDIEMASVSAAEKRTKVAEPVALRVEGLASLPMLKSASFELRRGEVLGIAGLIGSGRSELIRSIFGLLRSKGVVEVRGKSAGAEFSPSEQIRQSVGYLSEDRKQEGLCLQMSVADNVTMTAPCVHGGSGWIDRTRQETSAERVISQLNIRSARPEAAVSRLSGGNQQKVAFGRLLHQEPDIFLLDEPTRGIDVRSKADIYRQIRALADNGKAVVMVSSYLPELMQVCDRIAVMSRGRLSAAKDVAEWNPQSIMQAAIGDTGTEAEMR